MRRVENRLERRAFGSGSGRIYGATHFRNDRLLAAGESLFSKEIREVAFPKRERDDRFDKFSATILHFEYFFAPSNVLLEPVMVV
jgi:hypothetical protein